MIRRFRRGPVRSTEESTGPLPSPGRAAYPAAGADPPAAAEPTGQTGSGALPTALSDAEVSDLGKALQQLTGELPAAERRAALRRLVVGLARSARAAGVARATSSRWLVEVALQVAPHLTVRDLPTLVEHHHGLTGDDLADSLIRTASRVSAGIGAGAGALATVEYAAPPALLGAPVQLVAETLAVLGVEIRLLAELQVVYGQPVTGPRSDRAVALLTAWASGRGVDLLRLSGGASTVLGQVTRRQLRERLRRRLGRSLTAFGPLLTGAVIGAELNRRGTRSFGESVREDLAERADRIVDVPPHR